MQSQGWRWFTHGIQVLLLAGTLAACGKKKDEALGWESFPVPLYADDTITQNPEKLNDLYDAIEFWEGHAGQKLFNFLGTWNEATPIYDGSAANPDGIRANVVFFLNPWAFSNSTIGMTTTRLRGTTIESAMIMMNPHITYCNGDCDARYGVTSERKSYTHELGHFLGLAHIDDPSNIMYPDATPGSELSTMSVDAVTLQALITR